MANKFILASASPRRKELLAQVGVEFEVIPAKGEEIITSSRPGEVVVELAVQKAEEVKRRLLEQHTAVSDTDDTVVVLGADTVVAFEGQILGKPKDAADAEHMLSMLSGNTHGVYTGVAVVVIQNGESELHSFYEETKVTMYPVGKQQILSYIRTGEPMDKAGAYGIQGKGALLVQEIHGDYNNVVGLPVAKIFRYISALNF